MKASELRIGNSVMYNGKIISISPIALSEYYYIGDTHNNSLVDKRHYEPMPLTEKALIDFGFKKDILSATYRNSTRFSVYENDGFLFAQIDNVVIRDIYFIHDLQNLYFSVTNKELSI